MSRKSFIPLWGDLKQTIDSYASSQGGWLWMSFKTLWMQTGNTTRKLKITNH